MQKSRTIYKSNYKICSYIIKIFIPVRVGDDKMNFIVHVFLNLPKKTIFKNCTQYILQKTQNDEMWYVEDDKKGLYPL